MDEQQDELSVEFSLECDKFTKAWANDLVKTLRSCFQQMSHSLNAVNTNLSNRLDNLEQNIIADIKANTEKVETALNLANNNKTGIDQMRAEMVNTVAEIAQLKIDTKSEIQELKQSYTTEINQLKLNHDIEIRQLKSHTTDLEAYSRRENLLFFGIDEPQNESNASCEKSVRKFCRETLNIDDAAVTSMAFVRCHRLRGRPGSRVKPIIVRFKDYKDRELIWSRKSQITNRSYNIGEDFPRSIAFKRRKLLPVFNKARNLPGFNKQMVSLKSDVLTINGRRYYADTLDQLTGQLNMKHFNERSNENLLVFGGIYSNFHGFSNYFPCKIKFKNKLYCNAEQAYQHRRALFVNDLDTATKIMVSSDPAVAKQLSYDIKGSKDLNDRWNTEKYTLMSDLVKAKITQNPKIATELIATGARRLAESGRHDFYAVGLPITHKDILDTSKWTGKSKLGEILMSIRQQIK